MAVEQSCYTVMDEPQAVARHHAILIGIDDYPIRRLKSCVRDVEKIKECLENKITSVNIQTLKASSSEARTFEDSKWPTYRNVESAFERTISQAKRGDFVYIHYSGHGTRLKPCFKYSNYPNGDLALVLLEGDQSKEVFLKGPRLAGYLNSMVKKELIITLVLDCCFSASVYRNSGPDVRYLPCDHSTASSDQPDRDRDIVDIQIPSLSRDISMRDNWLLDPDRYTILAACGPHEIAQGGSNAGREDERSGALSHFLYEDLCDYGFERRHKDIHRRLCAKFRQFPAAQHPVLYGNDNQGFFGPIGHKWEMRVSCVTKHDGGLYLLAGKAHGLRDGDRFALLNPSSTNNLDTKKEDFTAKISHTGPLTSRLEMLDMSRDTQTGWMAKPLSCSYLMKFPIRLAPDLHHEGWIEALEERSLHVCLEQGPKAFQLVLNNDTYEILDSKGQKIINLPILSRKQTDIQRVCEVLEHIARYSMVKDLNNDSPDPAFQDSFDIHITKGDQVFRPDDLIQVEHCSILELVISNKGNRVLYVHVYNLNPCLGVKSIFYGTYDAIEAHGSDQRSVPTVKRKLRMKIPPSLLEHNSCEDVLKIFVTSKPTSFDLLELPDLDESELMSAGNRISHLNSHEPEDWAVITFAIRTSLPNTEA